MPLPFIIGGLAAAAAIGGVGSGIHGGMKMKEANDTMKLAKEIQERAINDFERKNKETNTLMDEVGKKELKVLASFKEFSELMEKIQNKPEFKEYSIDGVKLPAYEEEKLKDVSVGAAVLLGGLGGAATGTAGGFAAAGATTSAIMALGTASTGTAISTLSGAAATNATLAALGGGAISAGGGGMALGSAILGGATLGVGLLVGGVIFNVTGSKLSDKADEAYAQAKKTEREVEKILAYLKELCVTSRTFKRNLESVTSAYKIRLEKLKNILIYNRKTDWNQFSVEEKLMTKNLVMLVGLLYRMCRIKLVLKSENDLNTVNKTEVDKISREVEKALEEVKMDNAA